MWLRVITTAGLVLASGLSAQETIIERGEYLLYAGGCVSCHTADTDAAVPLAGGRAIESPFGTFYTSNITPDMETGIGGWTDADFLNALWTGESPDGSHYFPAFPYTSYTGVTEADLLAIKAYLFSIEPVRRTNQENELAWYLATRMAAGAWKLMNFSAGRFVADPERSPEWNRGAYLVRHLGHCGECHTPRSQTGALLKDRELAGNPAGPEGKKVPGIDGNSEHGIGDWSMTEIKMFLELGMLPDGDFVGGAMSAVIDDNTSHLTEEDRHAVAVYLKSLVATGDSHGND
jgi:mono/diheme cytochrome c family protein